MTSLNGIGPSFQPKAFESDRFPPGAGAYPGLPEPDQAPPDPIVAPRYPVQLQSKEFKHFLKDNFAMLQKAWSTGSPASSSPNTNLLQSVMPNLGVAAIRQGIDLFERQNPGSIIDVDHNNGQDLQDIQNFIQDTSKVHKDVITGNPSDPNAKSVEFTDGITEADLADSSDDDSTATPPAPAGNSDAPVAPVDTPNVK
jgi:hypothetical protein